MTNIEFATIKKELNKWRKERHLDVESQRKGYLGNIFEELSEMYRAEDSCGIIDALCDMVVFSINAHPISYLDIKQVLLPKGPEWELILGLLKRGDYSRLVWALFYMMDTRYGFDPYNCMMETIKEISSRSGRYDKKIKKFVKDHGLYPEDVKRLKKSMTVECESDEWITFADGMDSYTYKKWYKADYSKCLSRSVYNGLR